MKFKATISAAAMGALSIFMGAGSAAAQSHYPDHPVRMVVGYPPGGPVDIIGRIVADRLSQIWKQPVVVENVSGAGGNIAGDRVAKATPDGYTLLMATNASLAINPSLYAKMTYNPIKDLMPISQSVYSPNILVVPNSLPVKSVKELVAYAKAHPGKLTFGSAGVGTTQHLAGELFKTMAGIEMQHVPYRGGAPVITDLLGGRLTMSFIAIAPAIPLVREGKVRALAVTSEKRFGASPDLPTMIEEGYPGFVSVLSIGLMAPVGTPPAIIENVHQASVKALSTEDVRKKLSHIGMEVIGNSPAEFAAAIKAETPQWSKVIKDAGIAPSK
jgi:tripartite-type tricarboxylate transporter receptor subunit TctC